MSETGASYGDLDEEYLKASYRVYMDESQAKRVIAEIKRMQASTPVWNAAVYNCVAFIQDIARDHGSADAEQSPGCILRIGSTELRAHQRRRQVRPHAGQPNGSARPA